MEEHSTPAESVEISISITSEILYYDDHVEPGPSTYFDATVRGAKAFWHFGDLYNRTIEKITQKPFGGWRLWKLTQIMSPSNPESTTKWITYFVSAHAVVYFPDGTTEYLDRNEEYCVPLYNSSINWNLEIE